MFQLQSRLIQGLTRVVPGPVLHVAVLLRPPAMRQAGILDGFDCFKTLAGCTLVSVHPCPRLRHKAQVTTCSTQQHSGSGTSGMHWSARPPARRCFLHFEENGVTELKKGAHWSVNRSILPPLRSTSRSWLYLHLKPLVHLPCRKYSHSMDLGSTPARRRVGGIQDLKYGRISRECSSARAPEDRLAAAPVCWTPAASVLRRLREDP